MKAGKVGVHIAVKGEIACWFGDHSFAVCFLKVTDDCFDGGGVTFLWVVRESSDLTNGKSDVWVCVGGQIQEHANN